MFGWFGRQNKQAKEPQAKQEAPPPPPRAVDAEDEELFVDEGEPKNLDQFEQQLQDIFEKHNWPIDEDEPGFPLVVEDLDGGAQEEAIDVIPGLPLFAHRHREAREVQLVPPKQIKQVVNNWPKKQQQKYLAQLRENFPELGELRKINRQIPPNLLDEVGERFPIKGFRRRRRLLQQRRHEDIERLVEDERREYDAKRQIKEHHETTIPRHDKQDVIDLVRRALKNNTEEQELKHLNYIMGDKKRGKPLDLAKSKPMDSVLPSRGTAHLEDFEPKILNLLFEKFTFQGILILSKLSHKWNHMFRSVFESQTYLWFCNENRNSRRFLPIEDCCVECHQYLDSEPVMRLLEEKLIPVIEDVLSLTKNLKCLRLYRFEMDRLLIVRKLSENCPQIQHLDLTECFGLTINIIKELCHTYPKLKDLILTATNLKEEMLAHIIKSMTNLVTLSVGSTLITGESLQSLPTSLKRLDIRCCPKLKSKELIKFLKFSGYIHLQHLKIDCYKDKEIYRLIWTFFKSSLILFEVMESPRDMLSGQSYVAEVPLMSALESLKLGKNVVFDSRVFDNLVNSCPNMRSFSMRFDSYDNFRISEPNLIQISGKWPNLERLELIECRFLGQAFIESLEALKNLEYLNLTESSELRDDFIAKMLPKLLKVNFLVLDNCINLGKRTVESVILRAKQMSPQVLRVSMIKCNLQSLPFIKSKHLPQNLRITYSSLFRRRYVTFDGQRTRIGNISEISEFLKEK